MYDLGEQFKFNIKESKANEQCVFKGNKYRITVLTERLIRLEYCDNGLFEDNPTEFAWYRNFEKPNFITKETDKYIKITTKYFQLEYIKEKNFYGSKMSPIKNLKVFLLNTDKTWYYKHPEARNYSFNYFDLNKHNDIQKSLYSLDGFVSIDDSKTSIILENGLRKKRENKNIDIYLFMYNKDFYYCLNDYFMLTGYPSLIPRYVLGNWWDKREEYNDSSIIDLVKKFEYNNVPISAICLGNNTNKLISTNGYKNLDSLVKFLNSKGIKVGMEYNDKLVFNSIDDDYSAIKDYLAHDKKGNIPFNLYDSRTVDAFIKLLIHPITKSNIIFFSIKKFNNDYDRLSILKYYLYHDFYRKQNIRPIISSLNSNVAPHRYPVLYSGKSMVGWDTLKQIAKFNSALSNIGVSFCSHDLGGTSDGIEENELFTRFIELGVFSPILKLGSDGGKYYKREPWKWGIKTGRIVSEYLNLRYKLLPYIYTEAYKYSKYGKPLIEPIYYRYPDLYDDSLYCDEYFFGSQLLISPIISRKDYIMNRVIQKLYIPSGVWYDFFTGKKYAGNKKYVSFYKEEEYPVFVEAGSIIPIALNNSNDIGIPASLEIQIFAGKSNSYSIYEDDGETNAYKEGNYTITNFQYLYKKDNYRVVILPVGGKISILPKYRNYKIRFRNTKLASKIDTYINNDKVLNKAYEYNNDLIIEVNNIPTNAQFTLICKGENIEMDAIRIINEDIESIITDLPIKTVLKNKIDSILFSTTLDIKKKRIQIRKLYSSKYRLERKYVQLFLKLLEYIEEV